MKTLFHLSKFVSEGAYSSHSNYFYHVAPNVTSVRWVTTCINILMLYCQEPHPSKKLVTATDCVQNIYVPLIFNIKKDWHVSRGPLHYFNLLTHSRDLLEESHPNLYNNVKKTLTYYSFVIHPENMLLYWLYDPKLKTKAMSFIKKKRAAKPYKTFRKFEKPVKYINFDAKEIGDLLDPLAFHKMKYSSPPILQDFTLTQIENLDFSHHFNQLCCHSQHVERFVWLTSESCKIPRNFNYSRRHQWILNHMVETKKLPYDCTNEDFLKLLNGD